MAMFVNTNVSALNAQRNLSDVTSRLNTSFERLSSGSRINSARDDAAGLQISDRLGTQIAGLNQATNNANNGIAIAQIAEGALSEITSNVQRMRQLVVQGGNTALSSSDRSALGEEFEKLLNINDDIADRTSFGDVKLLDGTGPSQGFRIHTGAFDGQVDTVTTGNGKLLGLLGKAAESVDAASTLDVNALDETNVSQYGAVGDILAAVAAVTTLTHADALATIFDGLAANTTLANLAEYESITINMSRIADALANPTVTAHSGELTVELTSMLSAAGVDLPGAGDTLSADQTAIIREYATDKLLSALSDVVGGAGSIRATLGAEQNGLSSTIRSNQASIVNVSDAKARISDTDFATETAALTRNQIIQQASNSILAQANQLPQAALSLLR